MRGWMRNSLGRDIDVGRVHQDVEVEKHDGRDGSGLRSGVGKRRQRGADPDQAHRTAYPADAKGSDATDAVERHPVEEVAGERRRSIYRGRVHKKANKRNTYLRQSW